MEQGLLMLFNQHYNSSLLHGPWTIVYGIATLIILWIGNKIANTKLKKYQQIILFLIITFFILGGLEILAGTLIEKILGIVYWDYSNLPLHIGHYTCVPFALIWSFYACIVNYILYPHVKKWLPKIPIWVTILLLLLFFIDIGYTIFQYLKYK